MINHTTRAGARPQDAIGVAMRDNFSDISFWLAFKSALDNILIDSVTLSKMFDVPVEDVNAWYDGESYPVQSKRSMILGMLLQSLVVHEEA